ncbi:MAG: oxygen-independent coproporphyrinogen III oxidase [Flavitalea sp.]
MLNDLLLEKYNVPVPRYTSYPTVPQWNDHISKDEWKNNFSQQFSIHNKKNGISLYIHLPFCESLCTYCGCNKKITTNHSVEGEYLEVVIKEWNLYLELMDSPPIIREIHLGGGTPTFFSPINLGKLMNAIYDKAIIHPDHEFSFEGHPNNTSFAHLQLLYDLGFRRVSYGVQDNDPEVQRIINRIQPLDNVRRVTEWARQIGYHSVNYDLIYGLPKQTLASIEKTVRECIELKPDRIAFYSYAHVPWTSKGQRLFDENDLPGPSEKIALYYKGREIFMQNGYTDIGMDHFALPNDELYKAHQEGRMHRNFMGYTTQNTSMLLGLGVSSISDTGSAFAQNNKTIHDYYEKIGAGELAIEKGYFLSEEDLAFRKYILDLICKGFVRFAPEHQDLIEARSAEKLEDLEHDGLIELNGFESIKVTAKGRNFIRNICSAIDQYQLGRMETKFSKAI